ncbi:MAG TPA: cysteine desulfurase family protein [Bacteroidia bacterium]|nr:cysteine desulfurase family protein [Bacteroidia bacterium]
MAFINNLIYFDNNATTKIDDRVFESMLPYLKDNYGNAASRLHAFGWVAQSAVEKAAEQTAQLINCEPGELIFTSGATESVNLAIKGIFEAYQNKGRHLITCVTEHKAVLDTCENLKRSGAEITYLKVDREGLIDLDELRAAIKPTTILVSIMAANNETGVIQPIEKIAEVCKENDLIFFSDATQFAGKQRCDVRELGIHCTAFSAHKMYGPKGSGALYFSRKDPRVNLIEQINGGGHQNGKRSGTLNVAGIVGLGKAAEISLSEHWEDSTHISKLKNYFEHQLLDIEGLRINGSTRYRLYNTSNISFPTDKKISSLLNNFAFSSGSACSSGSAEPSHVLKAMGLNNDEIKNTYRFSFGRFNTIDEVKGIVSAINSF